MKALTKLSAFKYLVTPSIIFFVMSCGGSSPQPSAQDRARALLIAGPWKIQSEMADGVDQTAMYTGFTIAFSSAGYTTTKGGAIWPASGTWNFKGTDATTIVRNDGEEIELELTASSLIMTLNWPTTTLGSGRSESIQGNNVFVMAK